MKTILSTLLALLLAWTTYAQSFVWPGDMNDNGIVNEVDILYWGSAYGSEGPARSNIDTSYIGYPLPSAWTQFFNNGLNYLYADANGDGRVDDLDLVPIVNHFGMRNDSVVTSDAFPELPGAQAPAISLTTQVNTFQNRRLIVFEVNLGTVQQPIDSFYGFSFRLIYDTLFAKNGISAGLAPENWIEQEANDTHLFIDDDQESGVASVAITRLDQQTVGGSGTLLRGIIAVEDIVLSPKRDTFTLEIDSVRLVGSSLFRYTPPDPVQVKVNGVVTSSRSQKIQHGLLRVYPNPARETMRVELLDKTSPIEQLNVFNSLGQRMQYVTLGGRTTSHSMSVKNWPPGLYTVIVRTEDGLYSQKLMVR